MSRRFDKALDNATDQTLVEPNWPCILECVDMIRGSDVGVKQALQSIQRRYHNENPHVAHHALLVLEACVKNCGKKFHEEIATKEFMDDMKNVVIEGAPDKVKNKILELIQCWSSAFEKKPEYKIVCDTHSFLKMYGFEFPKLRETDAMFAADSAPEWADGDNCFRCRVEFGVFTRKHHCRMCGQIFCDRCSNRQMLLPQFGIEKKVRVCETCYTKNGGDSANVMKFIEKITQQQNGQRNKEDSAAEEVRQRELMAKEQEELELALALSISENDVKNKQPMYHQFTSNNADSNLRPSAPAMSQSSVMNKQNGSNPDQAFVYRGVAAESVSAVGADDDEDIDPALSRYLDKRYWEQRQAARDAESMVTLNSANFPIRATAPPPSEFSFSASSGDPTVNEYGYGQNNSGQPSVSAAPNGMGTQNEYSVPNVSQKMAGMSLNQSDEIEETVAFCKNLREQVEIMDNRMRSNMMRGRSVVKDSAIQSLFTQLTKKHAEVLTRMSKLDSEREYFEGLQDHLSYIQEARQALIEFRKEHEEQRQKRLQEEQRLRAQQMQVKLEQIRNKKYASLMEQRHQALQNLQEQELRIQQSRGQVYPGQQPIPSSQVQAQTPPSMQMPPVQAQVQPQIPQQFSQAGHQMQQQYQAVLQPTQDVYMQYGSYSAVPHYHHPYAQQIPNSQSFPQQQQSVQPDIQASQAFQQQQFVQQHNIPSSQSYGQNVLYNHQLSQPNQPSQPDQPSQQAVSQSVEPQQLDNDAPLINFD